MNSAHSVLKKAIVTAFFLIFTIATCRSQSITPDEYVRAVAVNTNGAVRAEVDLDGVTETLAETQTRLGSLKPTRAFALAFSPNGRFLAAADTQGKIQVWDLSKKQECLRSLQPR